MMGRGLPIETWLPIFTRNIARVLRLSNVGSLAPGKQADLVILDRSGQIRYVMCRGVWLVRDGVTMQHGPFEEHTKVNQ
jgi:beta-aspartyl-dipeptidase (metallo-type)